MATTSLSYLIPSLRLRLGDWDAGNYRYLDEWLEQALRSSIVSLQRWWTYKYILNGDNEVLRNPRAPFLFPEPPVIEHGDETPIVIMATIIIKSGSLQDVSWSVAAWRDAEISFSNLEGSRSKKDLLRQDWELMTILTPPNKKLSFSRKGHLPGFHQNIYETGEEK